MLAEKFLFQTPSGLWHENYGKKASIYGNTACSSFVANYFVNPAQIPELHCVLDPALMSCMSHVVMVSSAASSRKIKTECLSLILVLLLSLFQITLKLQDLLVV